MARISFPVRRAVELGRLAVWQCIETQIMPVVDLAEENDQTSLINLRGTRAGLHNSED